MILYSCSDLIFSTRIGGTAEALGIPARPARNPQMLQNRLEQVDDGKPNLPPTGLLVDLDLGDAGIALIRQCKAARPQLPVLAFGSHVATELLQQARDAGADQVLSRGQFTANLPRILQSLAPGKAAQ